MKKLCLLLCLILLILASAYTQSTVPELENIQDKISAGYTKALDGDTSVLTNIINELQTVKSSSEHYLTYWLAFANYKLAAYYMSKDKKVSERKTNEALEVLEKVNNKNSEDYVLLGSLISFSLNFKAGETAILSQKARNYYQKALKLDKNNLRAYFSIGRSDYYKPKQYGGGEVVEVNLIKALSLPVKSNNSVYAPSWGKMETYELLVNFYLREERKGDAVIYCKKGLQEFPNSISLQQNLKKLAQ
ncbi:MAG: hypothetical protein H0U39_08190 [Segetibacter sp.]|nr:hypothetical protein [Segetibacter sp.]